MKTKTDGERKTANQERKDRAFHVAVLLLRTRLGQEANQKGCDGELQAALRIVLKDSEALAVLEDAAYEGMR